MPLPSTAGLACNFLRSGRAGRGTHGELHWAVRCRCRGGPRFGVRGPGRRRRQDYANTDPFAYANRNTDVDSNRNADRNTPTGTGADFYADGNQQSNADSSAHANRDIDLSADCNTFSHGDADAEGDAATNADSSADTSTDGHSDRHIIGYGDGDIRADRSACDQWNTDQIIRRPVLGARNRHPSGGSAESSSADFAGRSRKRPSPVRPSSQTQPTNIGGQEVEKRTLGRTGLDVTRLGLGLAEISRQEQAGHEVKEATRVVNLALDSGINFLDTAACYATTEETIGSAVSHRRDEFFLASKCGHAVDTSAEPWTAEVIAESVDRSLKRLRTDRLDILQLHTCTLEVLERGEVVEAVVNARDNGKTRFIGYSGDNEAAIWAAESGLFDTLQTSFNLVDQSARRKLLGAARAANMGIIIKRPVGNGAWGRGESPYGYANEYFRRAQVMEAMGPVPGSPENPILLAMGFLFAHDEVDTAIAGTHNPAHLISNIEMVENDLPISAEAVEELHRRFDAVGGDWPGLT